MSRARQLLAGAVIALLAVAAAPALPSAAGAASPRSGTYTAKAAGLTKLQVTFAVERGLIVRPERMPALKVSGLRCAPGRHGRVWTKNVTVRRGVLRGSWSAGVLDRRGRVLAGEAFEISGRWSKPGLVTGRMRWRRTTGRPCSSGWVSWRAAPVDPVRIASTAPQTFAVPGNFTIVATVTNEGESASPDTRASILASRVVGFKDPMNDHPQFAGAQPSQGTCDPNITIDPGSATLSIGCRLGTLPAHRRATVALTLFFPPDACIDKELGTPFQPSIAWVGTAFSPLNENSIGWPEPDATDAQREAAAQCPPAPPRAPAPVDEP